MEKIDRIEKFLDRLRNGQKLDGARKELGLPKTVTKNIFSHLFSAHGQKYQLGEWRPFTISGNKRDKVQFGMNWCRIVGMKEWRVKEVKGNQIIMEVR